MNLYEFLEYVTHGTGVIILRLQDNHKETYVDWFIWDGSLNTCKLDNVCIHSVSNSSSRLLIYVR